MHRLYGRHARVIGTEQIVVVVGPAEHGMVDCFTGHWDLASIPLDELEPAPHGHVMMTP